MNEEYIKLVDMAFQIFNDQMDTDYSRENVDVKLITADTPVDEIAEFLARFPDACEEAMFEPGYYRQIKGEALVTPDRYGIILRTDIEDKGLYWRHLVFHEISHIFCSTHELKDGNSFYKRYCADDTGDSVLNGIVCGGYAIWREFVADFLAILVDVDMPDPTLRCNAKEFKNELEAIAKGEPFIKMRIKTVLLYTLVTSDMLQEPDKESSLKKLDRFKRLQTKSWKVLLGNVYDQMFDEDKDFWEIDYEFIKTIGDNYMSVALEVVHDLLGENYSAEDGNRIIRRMISGVE